MSLVVSQLKDFRQFASNHIQKNTLLPGETVTSLYPQGSKKIAFNSTNSVDFDKQIIFKLPSDTFIRSVVLNVTLTYDGSTTAVPPAPALSAIKSYQWKSGASNLTSAQADLSAIYNHYFSKKGSSWQWSRIEAAGGYTQSSGTVFRGSVEIPCPWSDIQQGTVSAPWPSFLSSGDLQLIIQTETLQNMKTGSENPIDIEISGYVWSVETVTQAYADLQALGSYVIYSREYQTFSDIPLTTSVSNFNGLNASGRLLSYVIDPYLDASRAGNGSTFNKWLKTQLTQFKIRFGTQTATECFSQDQHELILDALLPGSSDGRASPYSNLTAGGTQLGITPLYYATMGEGHQYGYVGGYPLSQFSSVDISLASIGASSSCTILAEVLVALVLSNQKLTVLYP